MLQPIVHGLTALIVFVGISTPIIVVGIVYYYKKRLEHKQIMAAIEKGIPLSEIMPPKPQGKTWINEITKGIAMLVIAVATAIIFGAMLFCSHMPIFPFGVLFIIPAVFLGNGIASLVRGILQQRVELQNNSPAPENASSNQV
jgi:nucleoside permease NupC